MRSQCGKKHSLIPLFHEHRTSCEAWHQLLPFHAFQCAAGERKRKRAAFLVSLTLQDYSWKELRQQCKRKEKRKKEKKVKGTKMFSAKETDQTDLTELSR